MILHAAIFESIDRQRCRTIGVSGGELFVDVHTVARLLAGVQITIIETIGVREHRVGLGRVAHANAGYTRNRADPMERRDLYHVSVAALWTVNQSWRVLLAELAADTNVDNTRGQWASVARIGAIYTIKQGVDVDVGYQGRLNRAAPSQVLLFGLTVRWGP